MKRLRSILAILIALLFLLSGYLIYSLNVTEDNWIGIGIHLSFVVTWLICLICFWIVLHIEKNKQIGIWVNGIGVLTLASLQYFMPDYIIHLWNFTLGGIVLLVGYTLVQVIGINKLNWMVLMLGTGCLALIFISKPSSELVFTVALTSLVLTTALVIYNLFAQKN